MATNRKNRSTQQQAQETEREDIAAGVPTLNQTDWEAVENAEFAPESAPQNGDLRFEDEDTTESLEEDDDNPYQESDEALPDDEEEAALRQDFDRSTEN